MIIPKQIQIAGKTIEVITDHNRMSSEQLLGQSRNDEDKIFLSSEKDSHISRQCIEQTFIHECIHKINNVLSTNCGANDESYVNPLSELLYQVFQQIELKKQK